MKSCRVVAPSSIANLGLLFDIAGLAVNYAYDIVEVRVIGEGRLSVKVVSKNASIPSGEMNVAYHAAVNMLSDLGEPIEIEVVVEKGVPVGIGLGSSGATAAATVYALNVILGSILSKEELVKYAGAGEVIAAGEPHYDNVAASLLGGLVLVVDTSKPLIARLEWPKNYKVVVFRPLGQIVESKGKPKTSLMREILPSTISLRRAVEVSRKCLEFLHLASKGEWEKAVKLLNDGWEIEEARSKLIPGYQEAKKTALRAGALAFNIAGAGPSLFAVAYKDAVSDVSIEVSRVLKRYWGDVEARVIDVDEIGAREV